MRHSCALESEFENIRVLFNEKKKNEPFNVRVHRKRITSIEYLPLPFKPPDLYKDEQSLADSIRSLV